MNDITLFLITVAIGAVGGLLFRKLGVPSGAMVGSMLFVIILNLVTEKAYFIPDVKTGLQILSGAMTGCRVGREDVRGLKKLVKPIILLLTAFVLMNFTFGGLMILFTDLDVPTALFATSPGGASDMALIGEELGANPAYIALLQVLRLLIIFTFCPPIFKYLFRTGRMKPGEKTETAGEELQPSGVPEKTDWKKLIMVFTICTAAGLLFRWLGVTSGAMLGSMLAGATFTVFAGKNRFPSQIRVCMSILSGAFMGCRFSRADLANIGVLALPILIMVVGLIVFILFNGFLVSKFTDLDYPTALFASTPGGMTEMAILAEDMGVDSFKVSILHTIRLFFVVAFFPTMNKLVCSIFEK